VAHSDRKERDDERQALAALHDEIGDGHEAFAALSHAGCALSAE
jgi:hypothetical protein